MPYSDPQDSVQAGGLYAEMAYFEGNHCAHVAAWVDHLWFLRRHNVIH